MKIGYTCGVYDLFHVGHLNLFERCKENCDYLIVGVCDDEYVRRFKDKDPVISEKERARIIAALKCVDKVVIIDSDTTVDKLKAYNNNPYDILFVGSDWEGSERFLATEKQFKENKLNIEIQFLPYTQTISTSKIVEKLKNR